MIPYLLRFLGALIGTFLFSISMRAPRRAAFPTALLAGGSYILYLLIIELTDAQPAGYFFATLLIAGGSELLATLMRMPATIFLFPALVPLVPGIGIYRSMLHLIQKSYQDFLDTGSQTLLALGAMAVAIALVNELARRLHHAPQKRKQS